MKKVKRILLWILVNGAVLVVAICATTYSMVWASNILRFLVWFQVAVNILVVAIPKAREESAKRGASVPLGVSMSYDIGLAVLLAGYGWFFYAALVIVQGVLHCAIYNTDESPKSSFTP